MEKGYTYSFIIPHKNCPDLLQRCVDSIPERDDVQIIVVDDNSDFGKKPSLTERKGMEIVLLDASQSKGAGRARNEGLKRARGKWLLFADADDYYTEYLPELLDQYKADNSTDIVYLNANKFDENRNITSFKTGKLISNYLNKVEGAEMELRYNLWTPWSRMIKKSIVDFNNITFDELPATNDKMFCLYCSYYSTNIKVESKPIYMYYRPSQGSLTDEQKSSKMLDDLLDVRRRTVLLYEKAGYNKIPSFWILFRTTYVRGLSKRTIISKYWNILRVSKISLLKDQYRYYKSRLLR